MTNISSGHLYTVERRKSDRKIIPCKTLLNHELEKTTMECRGQLYVEKQVLVSYIPSIEIS